MPEETIPSAGQWLFGLFGILATSALGWVGLTSRKVQRHEVDIAVLKTDYTHIKESLERIEDSLGTRRKH